MERTPGDADYFAANEVYNWMVTLILRGAEDDQRRFTGHVTLVR